MRALVDKSKFKEPGAPESGSDGKDPEGTEKSASCFLFPPWALPTRAPVTWPRRPSLELADCGGVSHMPLLPLAHSLPPYKINNHNNKIIRRCKRIDYNAVFVILG